jgi:histidine triad (HIT) family protein
MPETGCEYYCDRILKGREGIRVHWENERILAFHHTNPLWERHLVLLPKRHIESLLTLEDADNDLLLELISIAKKIAGEFVEQFGACRVYTNLGSYQSAKHLHWHIGCGAQLRPY